jgi:hypothetical protein
MSIKDSCEGFYRREFPGILYIPIFEYIKSWIHLRRKRCLFLYVFGPVHWALDIYAVYLCVDAGLRLKTVTTN